MRFLFDVTTGSRKGIYLDIGASHPLKFNNTYLFYRRGWRGYNVDPIAANIRLFRMYRPGDTNICAAVGPRREEKEFFFFDPDTLSTGDPMVAAQYEQMGYRLTHTQRLLFVSPQELIGAYSIPLAVDILSLDVEGGEEEIIQQLHAAGLRPKAVVLETSEHSPSIRHAKKKPLLMEAALDLGYLLYADTFVNSIFVSKDFWRG